MDLFAEQVRVTQENLRLRDEISELRREVIMLKQIIDNAKLIAQRLKDTTVIIPHGEAM